MSLSEVAKPAGDMVAATSVVGTILQLLPPVAALFGILWYSILFYEKLTGKLFKETKLAAWIRRDKK